MSIPFNYFNVLKLHKESIILVEMQVKTTIYSKQGKKLYFMFSPNQEAASNLDNIVLHIIALILRHFKTHLK